MRFSVAIIALVAAANAAPLASTPLENDSVSIQEAAATEPEIASVQEADYEAADFDAQSFDEESTPTLSARAPASSSISDVLVDVLTQVGTDVAQKAASAAMIATGKALSNLKNWDSAREQFTQKTVASMYATKPAGYIAAVCYNKSYKFTDAKLVSPVTKAKLKSGILNTDYDCMYMKKGTTFMAQSDGGYINLAVKYDASCKWDSKKSSLAC